MVAAWTGGGPLVLHLLLLVALVAMVILFGGTVFWSSGAPFALLSLTGAAFFLFANRKLTEKPFLPLAVPLLALTMLIVLFRALLGVYVPYQVWTELLQLGSGLLVYWMAAELNRNRRLRSISTWVYMLLCLGSAMLAIWLHVKGLRNVLWVQRPEGYEMRASGTFICPNHFAQLLQMCILLCSALLFLPRRNPVTRIVAGTTVLFALPALFLTQSRAGVGGTFIGIGLLLMLPILRRGWKSVLLAAAALLLAVSVAAGGVYLLLPEVWGRLVEKTLKGDIRFEMYWPDTWRMIQGEGFWGAGPGQYRHRFDAYRESYRNLGSFIDYAHNEWLHLWSEYSLPVILLWIIGIILLLCPWVRMLFRAERQGDRLLAGLGLALFLSVLFQSVFDFNFHIPGAALWILFLIGYLEAQARERGWISGIAVPRLLYRICTLGLVPLALASILLYARLAQGSWAIRKMDQALKAGQLEEGLSFAQEAQRYSPLHWRPYTEQGTLMLSRAFWMRNPEERAALISECRSLYAEALARNSQDRIAKAGLARLSGIEGDWEASASQWLELVELAPFDLSVHIQLGVAQRKAGQWKEALATFEHAATKRRNDPQIQSNLRQLREQIKEQNADTPLQNN